MNDLMYIYLFRYQIGNFSLLHVDAEPIRLVQIFYFNREWNSNWGGGLRILKSQQAEDVYQEVPPLLNTSVVLIRSDNSWHSVTPVSKEATQSRLTLKVAFLKPEEHFAYKDNT
ncbi:2OG-Fe(II) oxygenase family protein [Nostoc sp.]|uniref:2OG-Fe(II) oxygenase family protein n=1 Tax=Nostoc sp. TaxID=1180 RepID=UPI002FFC74FA